MFRTLSVDWCRFAEILGAIGFTAARETVKLRIAGYSGNLIVPAVAAQHAQMGVVRAAAPAGTLVIHTHTSSIKFVRHSSKSVPMLAENMLKEYA